MARHLIARIGFGFVALAGVVLLTFVLQFVVPGDPARAIAPRARDEATLDQIRQDLHLNDTLVSQFARYAGGLLHGDLGESYVKQESVTKLILDRLPATLLLAFAAVIAEVTLGALLGLGATLHRTVAGATTTFNLVFLSVPAFALGLGLLLVFGFRLQWFPVTGGLGLPQLILPALTLGLIGAPYYAQIVRDQLSDSLASSYTRTAVSKGVSDRRILLRHATRNITSPMLTMMGLDLGVLLSGVVVVEAVFGWPGIGQLAVDSLQQLDRPVVMGTVILGAVGVILFNIVADVIRMAVDPRARSADP